MGAMTGGDGYLRIGELSRRTGVAPELLRAWERRYGLLRPARSEGGFRLYSEADEQRVERMRLHLREGLAAAEAARRAVEGVADMTAAAAQNGRPELDAGAAATDCTGRLRRGRSPGGARRPVRLVHGRDRPRRRDPSLPRRPRRALVDGRGDRRSGALRQQPDPWTVAGNRPRLGLGRGPRAVLACAPGEQHDLGLIAFGLTLNRRGWRITYLGPDTPVDSLVDAAARLEPDLVVVTATTKRRLTPLVDALTALSRQTRVAVAGSGATAGVDGLQTLSEDPVKAALSI